MYAVALASIRESLGILPVSKFRISPEKTVSMMMGLLWYTDIGRDIRTSLQSISLAYFLDPVCKKTQRAELRHQPRTHDNSCDCSGERLGEKDNVRSQYLVHANVSLIANCGTTCYGSAKSPLLYGPRSRRTVSAGGRKVGIS